MTARLRGSEVCASADGAKAAQQRERQRRASPPSRAGYRSPAMSRTISDSLSLIAWPGSVQQRCAVTIAATTSSTPRYRRRLCAVSRAKAPPLTKSCDGRARARDQATAARARPPGSRDPMPRMGQRSQTHVGPAGLPARAWSYVLAPPALRQSRIQPPAAAGAAGGGAVAVADGALDRAVDRVLIVVSRCSVKIAAMIAEMSSRMPMYSAAV